MYYANNQGRRNDQIQFSRRVLDWVFIIFIALTLTHCGTGCSRANAAYKKYYSPYNKQKQRQADRRRADFCRPKPHRVRL